MNIKCPHCGIGYKVDESVHRQGENAQWGADNLGEKLLDAVYETFYGGDTNIQKEAAVELMRQGVPPVY